MLNQQAKMNKRTRLAFNENFNNYFFMKCWMCVMVLDSISAEY